MNEPQKHGAPGQKPVPKDHILYGPICMSGIGKTYRQKADENFSDAQEIGVSSRHRSKERDMQTPGNSLAGPAGVRSGAGLSHGDPHRAGQECGASCSGLGQAWLAVPSPRLQLCILIPCLSVHGNIVFPGAAERVFLGSQCREAPVT